jgi:hypothetical protein
MAMGKIDKGIGKGIEGLIVKNNNMIGIKKKLRGQINGIYNAKKDLLNRSEQSDTDVSAKLTAQSSFISPLNKRGQ